MVTGLPHTTMKIDEIYLSKRKYKGKEISEEWVFGESCTKTKKCLLHDVIRRNHEILTQ